MKSLAKSVSAIEADIARSKIHKEDGVSIPVNHVRHLEHLVYYVNQRLFLMIIEEEKELS